MPLQALKARPAANGEERMTRLRALLSSIVHNDEDQGGPTIAQYAVGIALIVVFAAAALVLLGGQTSHVLQNMSNGV
jgi:hypothetical protein